ncbi:unnamed protein product [Musa hybrid cultivar]
MNPRGDRRPGGKGVSFRKRFSLISDTYSEMHWCCCYNKRQSTILLMDCETVRSHCISLYLQGLMHVVFLDYRI